MHSIQFKPGLPRREHELAKSVIETVLRAADPRQTVLAHLRHMPKDRPTHILAFGKASVAMTHGALDHLGDRFARATILAPEVITLENQFKSKLIATYPCDHPLPTQRNIDATRELIEHARSIPGDHRVLVLISGGASAMLCMPRPRVSLGEIRQTTKDMLQRGASIGELNAMRSQLETLKSGGLARELAHVEDRYVLLLSDVIGDDPSIIASGPMHDAHPPSTAHTIIASNNTALDALRAWTVRHDMHCAHIDQGIVAEASQAGQTLAMRLIETLGNSRSTLPVAVIMGGEPTVNAVGSDGIGGPMLELGLCAATQLAKTNFDWTLLTFTSDGMDGPSQAAGMIITSSMISNTLKQQASIVALQNHDSLSMCDTLGATIITGPTGTNVNDVAIAIRWPNEQSSDT